VLAHRTRTAALATLGAGLVAMSVAWLAVGSEGPLSALLGTGIVLAFFGMGTLPLAVVGEDGRNGLAWILLALGYVLRIMVGVVVYAVAVSSDAIDRQAVGITVIACALVWLNTQVLLGLSKKHRPTLDL
jgi:ATP synthase protein I